MIIKNGYCDRCHMLECCCKLLFLLSACHVYDDRCVIPRDNPGGGVTVRVSDLDSDGGS